MSSNLLVAVFGRSAFLVVEALEDGVLAETLLDAEHGFLHSALLVEGGLLLLLLSLEFLVVGEEVELDGLVVLVGLRFFYDIVGRDVDSAHQQVGIDDAVEEVHHGLCNQFRRRGHAVEICRAVGMLRSLTSIIVSRDGSEKKNIKASNLKQQ